MLEITACRRSALAGVKKIGDFFIAGAALAGRAGHDIAAQGITMDDILDLFKLFCVSQGAAAEFTNQHGENLPIHKCE